MFEVSVQSHFCGGHHLKGYAGKCCNPHGHNWQVEVFLRGAQTDKVGVLIDFKEVRAVLTGILDELDHQDLNQLPAFSNFNPTAEHIARHIYQRLSSELRCECCFLHKVSVSETPGTTASYWEE